MGSDGGSQSSTSTSYQNGIQPELMPYAMRMLGSASDMVYKNPIQQYTGQTTAGFSPLQQQAMGNIQGMQPSQYLGQGAALAGMAGTNQFTGANVNQYMSPYINNVIKNQQQGAIRNYATQLPSLASGATKVGGLGGSRNAIMESEAQSNLQNQLQGIQASGLQNAYQNAQQQFNTQNQNQLAAAGALGNFGQQQYTQTAGINQALMNVGALQQAQEQNALNASMQKFQNAQMEPYQRLNFMSSLIRGVPVQNMGQTMTPAIPSTASQIAGLGMGMYGMNQAFGQTKAAREGGSTEDIKSYAGGGIVSLAGGGSTTEKMGAVNARMEQLKQANPSMPMEQVNAQIQQETQAIPNSIPWQNAAALLAYNKAHPVAPQQPPSDTVVVQMAKQIAAQADAKKMAAMQQAQQMAPQQMPQQGLAGLPTPNVGQNYTDAGITAQPQEASDQQAPTVQAAEGGGIADLKSNVGEYYAGGGIVAFDDGGDVKHYAGEGTSLVSSGAPMFEEGYTPNWTKWQPGTSLTTTPLSTEEAIANAVKRDPSLIEKAGYKVGQLKGNIGGIKGALGKVTPYAGLVYEGISGLTDGAKEDPHEVYTHDPSIPLWERAKQSALDIAPEAGGTAGAIVGGSAGTVLSKNPLVGFGAGIAGYGAGHKLVTSALPATTEAFDKWYKEVWLPKHPEGGTPAQVASAAQQAGVTPPADITKYFANQSSYASGLMQPTPISSVGPVPDVMKGIEAPEKEEALVDKTLAMREKYGIGAAAKNFVSYLDSKEAELASDAKFNKGLALANFGFKMMSTPGGLATSLGAGGAEFAQNMMALKKDENAAKLGLYQAKMQAESAVEQGKAGAIDSAMTRHDQQLTRYETAKNSQAQLTAQYAGLGIQAQQANNAAIAAYNANKIAAGQLDLAAQKDQFQKAYVAAIAKGDTVGAEEIRKQYQLWNEATTPYLTKTEGLDATARQKLATDTGFSSAYNIYANPKTDKAARVAALVKMRQRAGILGISENSLNSMLGLDRGTLTP
jgi:hypothetical protein